MAAHQGAALPLPLPGVPDALVDGHGRQITYLRLAITNRCTLRCRYCMPAGGVDRVPHAEILSYEELERLVRLLSARGVSKVRITGGEPFARRDCVPFMQRLRGLATVRALHVTTNGVQTRRHLDALVALGLDGLNLSLDTLDRERFAHITRRDQLSEVLATLHGCLERGIPLKINAVALEDTTDAEILALCELPRRDPLSLRFIEEMPFSGAAHHRPRQSPALRDRLHALLPALIPVVAGAPTTARLYTVPGFAGTIGVIEGSSCRFCSTCNKIRITPTGMLKTCLYDDGVLDLKRLLRGGVDDGAIADTIQAAVCRRHRDGLETTARCARAVDPAMADIGG